MDVESYIREYESRAYHKLDGIAEKKETKYGYVYLKPPDLSQKLDSIRIGNHELKLKDRVLMERAVLLLSSVPARDHPEEDGEVVTNIGDEIITYVIGQYHSPIAIGETIGTYQMRSGYNHGYKVTKPGLLYVAKAVFPAWIDGNNFSDPKTRTSQ